MKWGISGYRRVGRGIVCGLAAFSLWCGTSEAARATRLIDYLSVEANEGDSSGGHAAIRFGDETFHFQHETPGILRVRRFASAAFDHTYAMLGNRTIRESRIAVSEDTYDLLRDAFMRRFLIQDAQLEYREALRRDVSLFELLLRQASARPGETKEISLPLKGLGYFLPDTPPKAEAAIMANGGSHRHTVTSPALLSLRSRIQSAHGEQFLAQRLARARATLREMELRAAEPSAIAISPESYPSFATPASVRYEDALHGLYALEVLQAAPPLRPGTFRTSDAAAFGLEPPDALALKAFAEQLEGDLVDLVTSSRADWGLPFIVGLARLAAIEASLTSGRFVFLDILPEDRMPPRVDAALRPYLPAMARERQEVFLRRRGVLSAHGTMREADYALLERAGNLLLEVVSATVSGRALRKDSAPPFPSREARLTVPVPGNPDVAYLTRELAAARKAEHDYTEALDRLYSYDLVRRNCVTEIFAVINRAIAEQAADPAAIGQESEQRLGGFIDASRGLTFIPSVSAREVATSYGVVATRELPSYRTLQLTEMSRRESPFAVFLRESNTLTSTIYRPGPNDSKFLFFTNDTPLLRPLFGAFNLLVGVGESLAGIATMPAAGTDRLYAGAKGVLFSLPELVFVNLRKGSTAYVEQREAPSDAETAPRAQRSPRPEESRQAGGLW